MTAFVLFLRGINVGGGGKLPMAALKALLADLGCEDVSTYIQSGNAVFRSTTAKDRLAGQISDRIAKDHGFRPEAFLLTEAELTRALDANPWPEAKHDAKPMHLFFHDNSAKPDKAALDDLLADGEAWHNTAHVLYFRAPQGIGRSKFAAKLDRYFKARKTARNLRTCEKMREMVAATG